MQKSRSEQPLLFTVCQKGHTGVVKVIFDLLNGSDELLHELVTMKDGDNKTVLHCVCEGGNAGVLDVLLTCIIDSVIDLFKLSLVVDDEDRTSLHLACQAGHADILTTLFVYLKRSDIRLEDLVLKTWSDKKQLGFTHGLFGGPLWFSASDNRSAQGREQFVGRIVTDAE